MAPKTVQYGPRFVRNQVTRLSDRCSSGNSTGWRDHDDARVQAFTTAFLQGAFGLGVSCGVQIIDKEDASGQQIIDDGVSTVAALKTCMGAWEANPDSTPDGEAWSESLVQVFRAGLQCRVVAYADNDDREDRSAWNTAKHDEESNTVRWSTLHQK